MSDQFEINDKNQGKHKHFPRHQKDDFGFFDEFESINVDDNEDDKLYPKKASSEKECLDDKADPYHSSLKTPSNIASLVSKRTLQVTLGIVLGVISIFVCTWMFETLAPILLSKGDVPNKNGKDKVALVIISETKPNPEAPFELSQAENSSNSSNSSNVSNVFNVSNSSNTEPNPMLQKADSLSIQNIPKDHQQTQSENIPQNNSQHPQENSQTHALTEANSISPDNNNTDKQDNAAADQKDDTQSNTKNVFPKQMILTDKTQQKTQSKIEPLISKQPAPSREKHKIAHANVPKQSLYTIQILGMFDAEKAKAFINSSPLKGKLHYYQTWHQNKPWFVVVYGSFESHTAAAEAMKTLPSELREKKPWIRSIADIQAAAHAKS